MLKASYWGIKLNLGTDLGWYRYSIFFRIAKNLRNESWQPKPSKKNIYIKKVNGKI